MYESKKQEKKEIEKEHVTDRLFVLLVVSADRNDSESLRPGGEALITFFIHRYDRIVGAGRDHPGCGITEDIHMCDKTF